MNSAGADPSAHTTLREPDGLIEQSHRAPLAAWLMVCLLSVLYIISFLDRTVIALMVKPIKQDLGISDVSVGLLVGVAFAIFYSVMGLPMGYLVDKFPRRVIIYIGVTIWSLAQLVGGFTGTFMHLFVARLLLGAGEAALTPATHSMISDAFPKRQMATAMSLYSIGAMLGIGAALLIGGVIVEYLSQYNNVTLPVLGTFKSWQLVFLATGIPGLFLAFAVFVFPEPKRRTPMRPGTGKDGEIGFFRYLRRNWKLWTCIALSFGMMNIANGALVFWQPAYLARFFDWSPGEAGTALGTIQLLAGTSGMLFSGWFVDRWFARGKRDAHLRYYLYVLLLTTPIAIVALTTPDVTLYLGLIWIANFVTVNSLGYSSAAVMLVTPGPLRGRVSALFTSIILNGLGLGLGPLVPAAIAEHVLHDTVRLGYSIALTMALCAVIAVISLLFGMKWYREALDENGL
jgi:MFS family permease